MRVHLNKKLIKFILCTVIAIAVILILLKFVSVWEKTQGVFDLESIKVSDLSEDTKIRAPDVSVREPTEEERKGLSTGSITKDELIATIVADAVVLPPEDPKTGDAQQGSVKPPQPVQTEYERRIAEITAEAYVLRDEYIVTLERMYAEAEGKLTEASIKENNGEEIAALVSSYLTKATELEVQCDKKVDIIVAELENLIGDNNGDESLIDTLIETYATEKATKKAWYINRLKEKGLIS